MTIDSDASVKGWGACCGTHTTRGAWSQEEAALHINYLELLAGQEQYNYLQKANPS